MSKRNYDINGWLEVKDNPISKVGVYPYMGAMIDPNGEFGLDPNKAYNVMRPAEELSDPETIKSFRLVPWIDEHTMLGDELTTPDDKGVDGVIGEDVYFDESDETLKANIKLFGKSLKDQVNNGKKELSCGYRCKYDKKSGTYNGKNYDFVQRNIRGNHIASVDEGRMGPEVAVLDGNLLTFTIDSKELKRMEGKETKDMSPEEMMEAISGLVESVSGLTERMVKIEEVMSAKVEDAEEESETEDAEEESETEDAESSTMDSLKADNEALQRTVKDLTSTVDSLKKDGVKVVMGEISKRDALAVNLSQHIGTFDHAEMTLAEVAVYGADKLELKCEKGTELATLNGFLHNRQPMTTAHALDSKSATGTMDGLDDYLKGGK